MQHVSITTEHNQTSGKMSATRAATRVGWCLHAITMCLQIHGSSVLTSSHQKEKGAGPLDSHKPQAASCVCLLFLLHQDKGDSKAWQVFALRNLTSKPPFCCGQLLWDQPRWSLVCIPPPTTMKKLQKGPKWRWPLRIQNVVHKRSSEEIALKRQPSSSPGAARERKDPLGRQLAHPAVAGSCMMDGFHWGQRMTVRDRSLFLGSCTLSFDLPHWPVCLCMLPRGPGPLQAKSQKDYSCRGSTACCPTPHLPPIAMPSWQMVTRVWSRILNCREQGFQSVNLIWH